MSSTDLEGLFQEVMSQKPSDRLRIAATLLDKNDKDLTNMAVQIAQTAIDQIRLTRVTR